MTAACLAWAIKRPVEEPIEKLALMGLADGALPSFLAEYYKQPDWDFDAAVASLKGQRLITVAAGEVMFNVAPAGTPDWQSRNDF